MPSVATLLDLHVGDKNPGELRSPWAAEGGLSLRVRRLGGCPACHAAEISPTLLRNHTAGDAVAGVARGVGLLVVGLGVHYDCGASVAEQGMAVAAERDVFILPLEMRFAVRAHGEVGVVTGVVTFRILQSMLLSIGIEVASRGLEVRGVALRVLMKVDSMFARRQIFEIDFHLNARGRLPKNRGAYNLALGIFDLNQDLGRTGRGECDHEQCEREQASGFHGGIIAKWAAGREPRAAGNQFSGSSWLEPRSPQHGIRSLPCYLWSGAECGAM